MVVEANDEFFAPKENLLDPAVPVFVPGSYTDRGKWMDGWETRRRRAPGHDWCVVRLGVPGVVHEAVVDTTHFRGNHPESFSLDGCSERAGWTELMPRTQAGVRDTETAVLDALAQGNREYEERFGQVFLICASGRSATDILAVLRQRLGNDAETETRITAEEQRKITRLRLTRLLREGAR